VSAPDSRPKIKMSNADKRMRVFVIMVISQII